MTHGHTPLTHGPLGDITGLPHEADCWQGWWWFWAFGAGVACKKKGDHGWRWEVVGKPQRLPCLTLGPVDSYGGHSQKPKQDWDVTCVLSQQLVG